jgi:hypothetical protein
LLCVAQQFFAKTPKKKIGENRKKIKKNEIRIWGVGAIFGEAKKGFLATKNGDRA